LKFNFNFRLNQPKSEVKDVNYFKFSLGFL